MNRQESIRKHLKEVRVPRNERVELYKDNNIIVVVPLTHRALQKYAHKCQWCINDDESEWEDYHKGKHAVIIQRNPKKPKKGITGMETYGEIFILSRLDDGMWDWKTATDILGYDFGGSKERALDYYVNISNDINNFATNIVYYSPETGIYDQEDNFLWNFNFEISDIPNVTPEVIEIMDDYLQESEEMNLQESIRKILKEELNNRGDCNIIYVPEQYSKLDRFSNLWDMVVNDIDELEEVFQLEKEFLQKDITVYSVQEKFDTEYVKKMNDERYNKSDISLFKYKNKLYIIDGHHRLCYDRINNRDSYVYIFDKNDSEIVDCIFYGIGDC